MNVLAPPVLKATIATIFGLKKDPVKNRYWMKYCPGCRQMVSDKLLRCQCGSTSFIDPDQELELQFSGWDLVCTRCQAPASGLGDKPCASCGSTSFRIIKPRYALNASR